MIVQTLTAGIIYFNPHTEQRTQTNIINLQAQTSPCYVHIPHITTSSQPLFLFQSYTTIQIIYSFINTKNKLNQEI